MTEFKKICVLGMGYVGLPTAAIFASRGVQVIGVDINNTTVETINQGKIHIVEPGLDRVVKEAVKKGKLTAVSQPQPSDAFIIAVPTPFKESNKPLLVCTHSEKIILLLADLGRFLVIRTVPLLGQLLLV